MKDGILVEREVSQLRHTYLSHKLGQGPGHKPVLEAKVDYNCFQYHYCHQFSSFL